jgi:hypothetical protein
VRYSTVPDSSNVLKDLVRQRPQRRRIRLV